MPNITISVDDETYKRAEAAAAALDTTLSELVTTYLQRLAATETERLKRQEHEIRNQIAEFTASSEISREDTHNRAF